MADERRRGVMVGMVFVVRFSSMYGRQLRSVVETARVKARYVYLVHQNNSRGRVI